MQIQPNERDKIAYLLASGVSQREVARQLGRSVSSINDEITRNSYAGQYIAIHAQMLTNKRKVESRHRHPLKNESVFSYVIEKLKEGWSPEIIDGRLKRENGYRVISYESIYTYIFDSKNKEKKLWEYLPRKHKRRYKKYGRKAQKVIIPNRVSIHDRDKSIETRKVFGHWEGDSIIGLQIKGKVIHTEVERQTRYLQALIINSKSSIDTIEAQKQIFTTNYAKSATFDNGTEFVKHEELHQFGIDTYFADPYCSGQRGTNENTNGLIRRYLPKKTSFDNLTQDDLDDIVWEINNRPKKVLNFLTPQESFNQQLQIIKGVRFQG